MHALWCQQCLAQRVLVSMRKEEADADMHALWCQQCLVQRVPRAGGQRWCHDGVRFVFSVPTRTPGRPPQVV
eukprot:3386242-Lingulodinium_polyedra.AAC.1